MQRAQLALPTSVGGEWREVGVNMAARSPSEELFYLRCWIGFVGVIAVFNALKSFIDDSYPGKRLYTLKPKEGEV